MHNSTSNCKYFRSILNKHTIAMAKTLISSLTFREYVYKVHMVERVIKSSRVKGAITIFSNYLSIDIE